MNKLIAAIVFLIPLISINLPLHADAPGATAGAPQTQVKAYGKFVPQREDDFAWENDKVAFRMYGPASKGVGAVSGVDCWLKRVDYAIIDKWYQDQANGKSYHTDWGEGHDPYHTGASRGCGGTAVWIDGKAYPAGTFTAWRILKNGPEQVKFALDYDWKTPKGVVQETKTITLALGSQLFQVDSHFTLNGKPANNLSIAIGLSTHDGAASVDFDRKAGWIATWEKIAGYWLGTGALIDPERVDDIVDAPSKEKDQSHIWLISHTDQQGSIRYWAGYGWERAGVFTEKKRWHKYLRDFKSASQ